MQWVISLPSSENLTVETVYGSWRAVMGGGRCLALSRERTDVEPSDLAQGSF